MPATDETVYTIVAGYVPTLGFKLDDFSMDSKHGPAVQLPNGTRYRGTTLNYGFGLAKDGSVRKLTSRIRGSIAWFEFSTSIKEVQASIERDEEMQEVTKDLAQTWYQKKGMFPDFNKEMESDRLLGDISRSLDMKPNVGGEEIEGSEGFISKKTRPEEFDPRGEGKRWGKEAYTASDKDLVGLTRAVDIYMEGRDGNIYRLDVTEMSLDATGGSSQLVKGLSMKGAHHGLGDIDERIAAGVTSIQLLAMTDEERATTLHNYFQGKTTEWNQPIKNLVNMIESQGSQRASETISRLKDGTARLSRMTPDIREALLEMRGGTGPAGAGSSSGSMRQAVNMLRKNTARNAWRDVAPTQHMSNYRAFESAMQFALHALGNIVRNFTTPGQVQGAYMTGYQLGDEGRGQDFVIGVLHRIWGQGQNVFQFKSLRKGDVLIANEARLTHHFFREVGIQGVGETQEAIQIASRNQNLLNAAAYAPITTAAVETNTIYTMAQADYGKHGIIHGGSMIIAPEDINDHISTFIQSLVGTDSAGNIKGMHKFLRNKLRRVSSLGKTGKTKENYLGSNISATGKPDLRVGLRGGPQMTANLAKELDMNAMQEGKGFGRGEYKDWLSLSGAMDLTPAQNIGGGTAFAYDNMGYGGRLGSSGTLAPPFAPRQMSAEASPQYLSSTSSPSTSKSFNPVATDAIRGNMSNYRSQAKSLLTRGLGGSAPSKIMSNFANYFANKDKGMRSMGASMAKNVGWHKWAKSMGPENKYYAAGEYAEKSRKAGWGEPGVPQLWAAPYVGFYYPAKQARVAER